jgi:hypothetical protein
MTREGNARANEAQQKAGFWTHLPLTPIHIWGSRPRQTSNWGFRLTFASALSYFWRENNNSQPFG